MALYHQAVAIIVFGKASMLHNILRISSWIGMAMLTGKDTLI